MFLFLALACILYTSEFLKNKARFFVIVKVKIILDSVHLD